MATEVLARTAVWVPEDRPAVFRGDLITAYAAQIREPLHLVAPSTGHGVGIGIGGTVTDGSADGHRLLGLLPAQYPEWLGDRSFNEAHGVRFPYAAGEMAGGIATTAMVIAMARADMLGFFGAGGLAVARVEQAVAELKAALPGQINWGVNLIHSPAEPATEDAIAALLLAAEVPAVSVSAFMELTPAVVRLAAHGLTRDAAGRVRRKTRLFAKVSRPEVAEQFMRPAPAHLVRALVERGHLTEAEAELAASVPVAEDITVEADSGGHTDNRALTVVMPIMLALRARLAEEYRYDRPIRVGAAGGLGTPGAVAAAFALGAAYVVTGSINQASVESGMSQDGKTMLSEAGMADVVMAPAADMFELGVKVQVLRRGTMFAFRAAQLHQVYAAHRSWAEVPEQTRTKIERTLLKASYADVWAGIRAFWLERDPEQVARAERDPRHQMALVFRWYLGMSSRWAVHGDGARRADYQIWCGPAMGAFNDWAAGSFLAEPAGRSVVQIARNLLEGAAVITRAQHLRAHGVAIPHDAFAFAPRPLD